MVRNTDGLKLNARIAARMQMQRATSAILLMLSEETEINFRSVATRAKVSTAWLYGTKAVRDKIVKSAIRRPFPPARICNIGSGSRTNESWRLSESAFELWR